MSPPESNVATLSDLIADSTVIVVGRLEAQVCRLDDMTFPQLRTIFVVSKFTVVVESALRGSAPGASLKIVVFGHGRVVTSDGRSIQTDVEGFVPPKIGDRVLLFLKPNTSEPGAFARAGYGEGIFRLSEDGTIRSPWPDVVRLSQGRPNLHGQWDGRRAADVIAEVARFLGR
ncbi:MAG TPA: hypothetical protein VLT86_19170 [Vicinamibacterales bacterium]|nr:hypothetical protein [Vicinamibacterales bacterium]